MKKIKLDLNHLAVETFRVEPEHPAARRGTVAGHGDTDGETCIATCAHTCGHPSCNAMDTNCVCYPVYPSDYSCYAACDTAWTGPGYPSCEPNRSCGISCEGGCDTQIC